MSRIAVLAFREGTIVLAVARGDPEVDMKGVGHLVGPLQLIDNFGSVRADARVGWGAPIPERVRAEGGR